MNKVLLIGRLGTDPEIKYTTSGKAVCKFSLATTEKWKDAEGNKQEKTEWHKIVIWGKLAEIAGEYLKKGSQVYLEGRNQTRSWESDGKKQYITEVVVNNFEMLDSKKQHNDSGDDLPF